MNIFKCVCIYCHAVAFLHRYLCSPFNPSIIIFVLYRFPVSPPPFSLFPSPEWQAPILIDPWRFEKGEGVREHRLEDEKERVSDEPPPRQLGLV